MINFCQQCPTGIPSKGGILRVYKVSACNMLYSQISSYNLV